MQPAIFNDRFSLFRFFRALMAAHFDMTVFWNGVVRPQEEALMASLDHYLTIGFTRQAPHYLQPLDLSLYLQATPAFDPTALWIADTPAQINAYLRQAVHDPYHLVPIYDYDAVLGAAALTAYRKTATFPADFLDVLALDPPALPLYAPCGQAIGLRILDFGKAVDVKTDAVPYKATWRVTFQHFEPKNLPGAVVFT